MASETPKHPDTQPVSHQYELAVINEECGEVVQIVGKTLRFGYESHSPLDPEMTTNLDLLHTELGDVLAAADFGAERGLLDQKKLDERRAAKLTKLRSVAPPPMAVTPVMSVVPEKKTHPAEIAFSLAIVAALVGGLMFASWNMGKSGGERQAAEQRLKVQTAAQLCLQGAIANHTSGQECDALVQLSLGGDTKPTPKGK